ncbi:MAG: hypothetical protein QOI19_551 [Thermoleophilaceae bacterium]|nr:hypothetical protein [Thermoleophilaceae bacterium]
MVARERRERRSGPGLCRLPSTAAVAFHAIETDEQPPAPFVVGVPRSGTTLLRLQLDAHPELAIPAETGFGALVASLAHRRLDRTELLEKLVAWPTWPDLGVAPDELAEAFSGVEQWNVGNGLRAYYRTYAARHGKPRWGDKTPTHAARLPSIARILPEARFIHLIRDGRDVVASLRGLPFAPGDGGVAAIAATWRDTLDRTRRLGARVPHYREVRYERLVAEPEAVLRELCDYLELEFDVAMLRAHERATERLREMSSITVEPGGAIRLPGGARIESHTREPPDPSRAGRWREALTEHDVAVFERLAGGALAAEGYQPSYAFASAPRRAPANRNGPMRVVIGTHLLVHPGGTESYVTTVAHELQRLGHDVVLTAEEFGQVAEYAEERGLRVARADADLPDVCDAVLAHDATMTAILAARYPQARLVYVAHSDLSDHQLPTLLPGVVDAVVACSDRLAMRMRALPLDAPIIRMREPIETDRFHEVGPLSERPRRALILSNYLDGERRRALVDAWEAAGVEVSSVGAPAEMSLDPRSAISEADIVVAKGRAALEAMCCGRAVYVYDQFGGDGWVTPDSYPALEADNFAGHTTSSPRTPHQLAADLDDYNRDMGWVNAELVRLNHGARHHANELVAVLRGARVRPLDDTVALVEIGRLARVNRAAEMRVGILEHQTAVLERRARAAEVRVDASQGRALQAEQQLADARSLLRTRRARAGITLGRALDRVRLRG